MPSQPPMILADNVYDRINLYPQASISENLGAMPGREGIYVADYRRERTYYQSAVAGASPGVTVDLGVGNSATVDTLWLDRGHNVWGQTVQVLGNNAGGADATVILSDLVPALGTVGGDPTVGWSVTEEGALYRLLPAPSAARRIWTTYVSGVFQGIFTGIVLGKRTQMLNYSSVLDEDEGERFERQENSLVPGYYGRDRIHTARKLRVQLATIGAAEYDSQIRSLRRMLFERDQPAFIVMNYGLRPERGWLYQYQGSTFSAPTERVYRRTSFVMGELGPLIR